MRVVRSIKHIVWNAGGWFNIMMPSYRYRKSLCGDKTILRPSYLHNGISYTGKMASLYWIGTQNIMGIGKSFCIVCCLFVVRHLPIYPYLSEFLNHPMGQWYNYEATLKSNGKQRNNKKRRSCKHTESIFNWKLWQWRLNILLCCRFCYCSYTRNTHRVRINCDKMLYRRNFSHWMQ